MEISFRDILNIIKKNIIFILIVSIVCGMGAFFVTKLFIPKEYKASVKLYVETTASKNESGSSYNDMNSINYAIKLVSTYIEMLNTNSFYTAVSKNLNYEYSAQDLKSMVSFTSVEDTEVFEADVVSKSPTESKKIADSIAIMAPKIISSIKSDNAELKIVDGAVLPKEATSPSASKNTLIAFFVGLIVALIISFVRDYFDIKIKYNEEMTTICDVPVLGTIPDFESFYSNKSKTSK